MPQRTAEETQLAEARAFASSPGFSMLLAMRKRDLRWLERFGPDAMIWVAPGFVHYPACWDLNLRAYHDSVTFRNWYNLLPPSISKYVDRTDPTFEQLYEEPNGPSGTPRSRADEYLVTGPIDARHTLQFDFSPLLPWVDTKRVSLASLARITRGDKKAKPWYERALNFVWNNRNELVSIGMAASGNPAAASIATVLTR